MRDKLVVTGIVALIAMVSILLAKDGSIPFVGSIGPDPYMSTSTKTAITGLNMANLTVLKSAPGTLGSVVITGAAAGQMNFYDATSTVTNSLWATTTLVSIPVSAAAGTYTLDVAFSKGLIYEFVTAAATATITWK